MARQLPLPGVLDAADPILPPTVAFGVLWRPALRPGTLIAGVMRWTIAFATDWRETETALGYPRYRRALHASEDLRALGYGVDDENAPVLIATMATPGDAYVEAIAQAASLVAAADARDAHVLAREDEECRRSLVALDCTFDDRSWPWHPDDRRTRLARAIFSEPLNSRGAPRADVAAIARDLVAEVERKLRAA